MGNGPVAADELRLLIERIERLEEEKKGIADDIKDVFSEAKSRGFCPKTMKRVIALRKLRPDERRELEAMLDVYKAALGMLDGTPLGTWAVEKLKKDHARKDDPADDAGDDSGAANTEEPGTTEPPQTIEDARRMGAEAARAGVDVTRNPFPARDARRAAWDEAWCSELGSDGMDIPAALRPAARKPKAEEAEAADPETKDEIEAAVTSENGPAAASAATGTGADDEHYAAARAAVLEAQYVSVSRIQRLFSIGYNRAAKIVEALEQSGVVSAVDATGKRKVLLDSAGNSHPAGENGAAGAAGDPQ